MTLTLITSCKKTKETETLIEEFSFAGYDFEVYEYKTINKESKQVIKQYLDTILVNFDCSRCKEICSDEEDNQDYRR